MKTFTIKEVIKWRLNENRNDPKPFPGNFPTRWCIVGDYYRHRAKNGPRVKHRKLRYLGKPNSAIAGKVTKLARSGLYGGTILFIEFDRGGPIKQTVRHIPFRTLSDSHATLLTNLYYFMGGNGEQMFDGRELGRWKQRKRVKIDKDHKIIAYDNIDGPWDAMQMLVGRQWLQDKKFVWSK